MKILGLWLRWMFSNSGIMFGGREPEGREMAMALAGLHALHASLFRYKCVVCGRWVWSSKSVKVCTSFKCFREHGGWR